MGKYCTECSDEGLICEMNIDLTGQFSSRIRIDSATGRRESVPTVCALLAPIVLESIASNEES